MRRSGTGTASAPTSAARDATPLELERHQPARRERHLERHEVGPVEHAALDAEAVERGADVRGGDDVEAFGMTEQGQPLADQLEVAFDLGGSVRGRRARIDRRRAGPPPTPPPGTGRGQTRGSLRSRD